MRTSQLYESLIWNSAKIYQYNIKFFRSSNMSTIIYTFNYMYIYITIAARFLLYFIEMLLVCFAFFPLSLSADNAEYWGKTNASMHSLQFVWASMAPIGDTNVIHAASRPILMHFLVLSLLLKLIVCDRNKVTRDHLLRFKPTGGSSKHC